MTNLERIRRNAGLSQEALAEKSGISRPVIVRIENGGIDRATGRTIRKLAEALGCSIAELF
jgi:transcriptional regulator with XRE-family HTH domain